jgi:hypothetical protein
MTEEKQNWEETRKKNIETVMSLNESLGITEDSAKTYVAFREMLLQYGGMRLLDEFQTVDNFLSQLYVSGNMDGYNRSYNLMRRTERRGKTEDGKRIQTAEKPR